MAIAYSADGTKLAAGAKNGNIWTSANNGGTWTERYVGSGFESWRGIASSVGGTKLAAVSFGGNIWTSDNSGESWTERVVGGGTKYWQSIASSGEDEYGRTKLAAVVSGGNIWTSLNSGENWWERVVGGGTKNWQSITSSADGKKLAAVVLYGNIWTSSNSGANYGDSAEDEGWTERVVGGGAKKWQGIASSADGTKLAAIVDGGNIWISSNSGATWTEITVGSGSNGWRGITSSAGGTKLAAVPLIGSIVNSVATGQCTTCPTGYVRPAGDLVDNGETECKLSLSEFSSGTPPNDVSPELCQQYASQTDGLTWSTSNPISTSTYPVGCSKHAYTVYYNDMASETECSPSINCLGLCSSNCGSASTATQAPTQAPTTTQAPTCDNIVALSNAETAPNDVSKDRCHDYGTETTGLTSKVMSSNLAQAAYPPGCMQSGNSVYWNDATSSTTCGTYSIKCLSCGSTQAPTQAPTCDNIVASSNVETAPNDVSPERCHDYGSNTAGLYSWVMSSPQSSYTYPPGCFQAGTNVYYNNKPSSTTTCSPSYKCLKCGPTRL